MQHGKPSEEPPALDSQKPSIRTKLPELRAGVYQHYRGQLYQVFGYAHDANDPERVVVVYVGLELEGARSGLRMAVRTAEDFFAWVQLGTGEVRTDVRPEALPLDGTWRARFRYLGERYDVAAANRRR